MRVGIVGAGFAGLSAATTLVESGATVTLVDKGRGPGGRTSTRHAGAFDFDHGAPLVDAHDPALVAQLDAWVREGIAARWSPRVVRLDADGHASEPIAHDGWVGVPGMNALAKALAAPLDLHAGRRVTSLARDDDGWRCVTDGGERLGPFDALVSTPPPPQTAALLRTAGLDDLAEEAEAIPMAPCAVVMLGFPRRVRADFDAAHVARDDLAWICRETAKPGRGDGEAWTLQATAAHSAAHFDDDDEALHDALVDAWSALGLDAPPPSHAQVHRWRYAAAPFPLDGPLVDPERGVIACGDWTHPRAGVEGAWLAGRDAARRLLDA